MVLLSMHACISSHVVCSLYASSIYVLVYRSNILLNFD
jgi:hypothetical protein